MERAYAISRFDLAVSLLPPRWQLSARQLPDHLKERVEELRLRAGHPATVLLPEGELMLTQERMTVSQGDLEQLCDTVTGYSRYAAAETIARGFLMAPGGFRVGLCGTAVVREGGNRNLRDLSSAVIRIGREETGLSDELVSQLFDGERYRNTLILAPPGLGKTTLLRDMIRNLSDGTENRMPRRVAVVDERGEIAGMYRGIAQLEVGCHTDVLDGCPKAEGIPILLRAANPQIIAVDEITERQDIYAMAAAANCGVGLLATVHAADCTELRRKPLFAKLLRLHAFETAVVIGMDGGRRCYRTEALE